MFEKREWGTLHGVCFYGTGSIVESVVFSEIAVGMPKRCQWIYYPLQLKSNSKNLSHIIIPAPIGIYPSRRHVPFSMIMRKNKKPRNNKDRSKRKKSFSLFIIQKMRCFK